MEREPWTDYEMREVLMARARRARAEAVASLAAAAAKALRRQVLKLQRVLAALRTRTVRRSHSQRRATVPQQLRDSL